ncbi:MAG TPA: hypothetical protein VN445_01205 [Rectinemataceae bacterium]|nr:hypothetical protein [Rectinemataceae bacterium]
MNSPNSLRMARLLRYPLLMAFMCAGFIAGAQSPAQPLQGKPEPLPPKRTEPSPSRKAEADTSPELMFRVRSAFSLTPDMLRTLQTKTPENGASSGAAAAGAAGSKPAAPLTEAAKAATPPNDASKNIAWGETLARSLPFAAPLDLRLVGKNVVVLIQIVPVALRAAIIDLIVQGLVWVKMPDDSLSFKTTVQSLSLSLGSRLYFYPLGFDAKDGAPIAVEIRVDKLSNP